MVYIAVEIIFKLQHTLSILIIIIPDITLYVSGRKMKLAKQYITLMKIYSTSSPSEIRL